MKNDITHTHIHKKQYKILLNLYTRQKEIKPII